jgi:transposase
VAKDLDLTESALRNWVNEAKASEEPRPAETLTAAEREEVLRLRKENRQLQVERDFLKNRSPPPAMPQAATSRPSTLASLSTRC